MTGPSLLSDADLSRFLADHPGWSHDGKMLARTYGFATYGATVGFAVAVAMAAEKRDHHPDLLVTYGKVEVRWTTHDVGGISDLDASMAAESDALFRTP